MNRKVALGVVIFFVIVGLALMGGQKSAVAGHGCHGCIGEVVVGCDCGGKVACGGIPKCKGLAVARRCHGFEMPKCAGIAIPTCSKPVACDCVGRVRPMRCHGLKACHGVIMDCGCSGKAVPVPEKAPEKAPAAAPETPAPKAASLAPMSFYQVAFRR